MYKVIVMSFFIIQPVGVDVFINCAITGGCGITTPTFLIQPFNASWYNSCRCTESRGDHAKQLSNFVPTRFFPYYIKNNLTWCIISCYNITIIK